MPSAERPHIIIDFEVDPDLVFLTIRNDSPFPAINIQIKPSAPIRGLGGTKDISSLSLFKGIRYLAPGKELRLFVDAYDAFFNNLSKPLIGFDILLEDEEGKSYRQKIIHDLTIYKDFIFFIKKS